jgi:hypothetical protein
VDEQDDDINGNCNDDTFSDINSDNGDDDANDDLFIAGVENNNEHKQENNNTNEEDHHPDNNNDQTNDNDEESIQFVDPEQQKVQEQYTTRYGRMINKPNIYIPSFYKKKYEYNNLIKDTANTQEIENDETYI